MTDAKKHQRYWIDVVARALDVLEALEPQETALTLTEVSTRLGLSRSSLFRLLYTLEKKGWIERVQGGRKFRRVSRRRSYRVGYAMLSSQFPYSIDVSRGLQEAADRHGIELIVKDNCYNPEVALLNAEAFVREKADFVIECQAHERVAPVISHLLAEAGIPSLAIDIPQPGAVFFGANNYQAGLIAGEVLGEFAAARWAGQVDKLLMLELPDAGPIPQARIMGALNRVQGVLGPLPDADVIHINGKGTFADSFQVMRSVLKSIPENARILVAAINDPSAVGAVRALEAENRMANAAVVGHNATREARAELRKTNSCLIGSVGYFAEKYGEQIIPIVLKILDGVAVPPAVYIEHCLISGKNVDQYYPADAGEQEFREPGAPLVAYPPYATVFS